ncbi:DNA-processing protein DprA [Desulfovirgula thermocuniculi]|uniref:DNA-processing protein DprA n=1 Tax=Desulfovirgula thermocuniculi TaxID=348842 RepID=UPI0004158461|nr:DNA-processing protein DprA [Desulfovirgula thermocuniculi]
MNERLYRMGWQYLLAGRARRMWELRERFGSFEAAWLATEKELGERGGFDLRGAAELAARRKGLSLEEEEEKMAKLNIKYITFEDPDYPELLRQIPDPPPGLFVRGALPDAALWVAIVGSRRPTPYGLLVAESLAKDLARAGAVVVSGMARGIDSAAHRGALSAGGFTVAVLGCGPDVVYPPENRRLMDQIVAGGAVVSEFPPGAPPEPWHFPVRNRLISGLSQATVVVEAGEKSGALITADQALEQGREVMAVPGPVHSPQSKGTNRLIKEGARLVEGASDVLEELGAGRLFPPSSREASLSLTPDEEAVLRMLSAAPAPVDAIIEGCGLEAPRVLSALMFLEVKGLVRQFPGRLYARRF